MSSPYGLQNTESCLICKLRHSGFFCDLPKLALEDLEKIKYASLGTPRETVRRVLGEFRDKELARLRGATLLIRNKSALERLIGA